MSAHTANAAGESYKTRLYVARNYFLKHGSQIGRWHEFMEKTQLPVLKQATKTPPVFLEALIASHMPQTMSIIGFESHEQVLKAKEQMSANAPFRKGFSSWESAEEPPYEHYSETLLEATDYSPELNRAQNAPRVFELRVYHSPTHRQLAALHERFAGPEIRIFHRCGIHPVLYTSTLAGQQMPNLTYLIPFDNLAAREKAWATFGADPEWAKVRNESIQKHGQIASVIQMSLWKPAPYSPVR